MSSYVVPALIATACAAGVALAARHALRSRAERRAGELGDAEFTAALFDSDAAGFRELPEGASGPAEGARVTEATQTTQAAEAAEATQLTQATEATEAEEAGGSGSEDLPGPRVPRQDPAMAALGTPARSVTPHPSGGLAPMLPAHLTGAHLLGVAARGTAITGLRSGTAGGLDVFDFADGGSIVVMPSDPEVAELVGAALAEGQDVRLLGTSEVGGGRSLTFQVHEATTFFLADRVYARPAS